MGVERIDDGWRLSFTQGFDAEVFSSGLGEEWSGKGLEFSAGFLGGGSLRLGVKDAGFPYGSEAVIFPQSGFVPIRWHVKHLCQSRPILYFRNNSYGTTTAFVSDLMAREIPSAGLKPVSLPTEEKKPEAGTKINLMDKWQAEGCRCRPVYPRGLEIDFLGLGSLYADLPFEVWGREVRVVMEMMALHASPQIGIILGDDKGDKQEIVPVGREPGKKQFERPVGQKAYVRLKSSGYDRFTTFLSDAYCEVIS